MSTFRDMDNFLSELVKKGPAGCGCAVAQDGKVLYENYFGYANVEKKAPVTAETIYRLNSTTKVMVCTGALMQFERGKFLLNDPISDYFPEWKNTQVAEPQEDGSIKIRPVKSPILVRDCFNMAMGIGYAGPEYTHKRMEEERKKLRENIGDYTLQDDIRAMSTVPVMFDPATHWFYGFGHELVAGLIEVTSGRTVSEFLQKEIFEPMEMGSTGYRFKGDERERLVTAYELHEDGSRRAMPTSECMFDERFEPDAKYEAGGAGLFSTVPDYLKFSQMLACGGEWQGKQIIGRKTIDMMRRNRLNEQQLRDFHNPYFDGYGYGLGVRTMMNPEVCSNGSVGEFGWTGFMGSYVLVDPSERASIIYMHNTVGHDEKYIHHRVRNIAYGALK